MHRWSLLFFLATAVFAQDASYEYNSLIMGMVQRGSFRSVLAPKEDVRLSSVSEGVVLSYAKHEGDAVKQGDVIMVLDPSMEEAELGRSEAILEVAKAEKIRGEKDFKRVEPLFKEHIASDKQYAEAVYLLAQAEGHYVEAVQAAEIAKIRLDQRYIKSPIDGVFFKKNKSAGEFVARYEVVARIIDASVLEFLVFLDPEYLGQFKVGDIVTLELLDGPSRGGKVEGKVMFVDTFVDPASGTFRVRTEVAPDGGAITGLSAKLVSWPGAVKNP